MLGGIVVVGVVGGLWMYGESRYRAGVKETVTTFVTQDQKGAKNVRAIAEQALRDAGATDDVDSLLAATGGLRDD